MPVISSIFLVAALVFAVVIGPQTRPWSWGPAMVALAVSVLAALPVLWKRGKSPNDFGLIALGALTAAWFAWRAWISPVVELGQADLLLVCAVVGAFISVRAIAGHSLAERCLIWGIALLLLANLSVIGIQLFDPTYSPVFKSRAAQAMISGFFAHYNETANYLIASSMLVGAAALFGRHATVTRIIWMIIAIAGLAGVWFTRSRGGILGAAIACGTFAAVSLMIGKRERSRWFAPVLIGIPVIGLAVGFFLFMGWQQAQEIRHSGSGIEQLLDNNARLNFLGTALSCIGLHPMSGGGSRSFSWECFQFVGGKINGDIVTHRPEMVHNELLQAATDYGILGVALLVVFLTSLALAAILRVLFEEPSKAFDSMDSWRLGALAALAGMLVQSCFSFVFHLMPGILLLGICLGKMSRSQPRLPNAQTLGSRMMLSLAAISCVILLIPAGSKGIRVTRILWPTHFSKQAATSAESQIDALGEAIAIWPQATLYQERGAVLQMIAGGSENPDFRDSAERAIDDYLNASRLHPYDPGLVINRANLLSQLQRDSDAEEAFAKAIQLQGGMEPGFRGHFSLATHYLRKGLRLYDPATPEPAHVALELSADQIETSVRKMHWVIPDMREPRVSIHESLGTAREAVGDREGALQSYNFAVSLHGGNRANYRAGVMIGKMAVEAWSNRRSSEALSRFIEARQRVAMTRELPQGITPSQRVEYTAYLDRTIEFLKGAKVEPLK